MELLLVIIAIIYSIWSEINKQKQEKNVDFDFSDLSSITDLPKNQINTDSVEPMPVSQLPSSQYRANARHHKKPMHNRHKSKQQTFIQTDSQLNTAKSSPKEPEISQINSLDPSSDPQNVSCSDKLFQSAKQTNFHFTKSAKSELKFDRNNLLKAFIMSEVMTRYDINRIFERIPQVRQDNE